MSFLQLTLKLVLELQGKKILPFTAVLAVNLLRIELFRQILASFEIFVGCSWVVAYYWRHPPLYNDK